MTVTDCARTGVTAALNASAIAVAQHRRITVRCIGSVPYVCVMLDCLRGTVECGRTGSLDLMVSSSSENQRITATCTALRAGEDCTRMSCRLSALGSFLSVELDIAKRAERSCSIVRVRKATYRAFPSCASCWE